MSLNVRFARKKNFDVLLVSLFNINEVWKEFRRISEWKLYREMRFNMHKSMLCFVLALAFAWIVNWWEETQTALREFSKAECDALGFIYVGCLQEIKHQILNQTAALGIDDDEQCGLCVQRSHRTIKSLVIAVTFVFCGLFVTFGRLLKIIFPNWLRFQEVETVWVVTALPEDEVKGDRAEAQVSSLESSIWEEENKKSDKDLKEHSPRQSTAKEDAPSKAKLQEAIELGSMQTKSGKRTLS